MQVYYALEFPVSIYIYIYSNRELVTMYIAVYGELRKSARATWLNVINIDLPFVRKNSVWKSHYIRNYAMDSALFAYYFINISSPIRACAF